MSIVLQFYPNGEFSQGVDTSKKRRDKRRDASTQTLPPLTKECRHAYLQWVEDYRSQGYLPFDKIPIGSQLSTNNRVYTLEERATNWTVLSFQDTKGKKYNISLQKRLDRIMWEWRLTPLVYQTVESCESPESSIPPSSRKKLKAMTKNMARNLRNGVYLLEQQPGGKDCLSFLTLTLPSLSSDGLAKCCANWDSMVKRFIDWLRIKVENLDINFLYVYCTEVQTKRLEIRHEFALHLHLVFRGRDGRKKTWAVTPKQARNEWKRCIASVVDELFYGDALENLQRIKKSASRYLGKYLSKGTYSIPKGASTDTIQALRTQWGGMAREISRQIKRNIRRFTTETDSREFVNAFLQGLPRLLELRYVSYYKKRFIPLHKDSFTGVEYGLHVCGGALSIPTYASGLTPILEYIDDYLRNCETSRIVAYNLTIPPQTSYPKNCLYSPYGS